MLKNTVHDIFVGLAVCETNLIKKKLEHEGTLELSWYQHHYTNHFGTSHSLSYYVLADPI